MQPFPAMQRTAIKWARIDNNTVIHNSFTNGLKEKQSALMQIFQMEFDQLQEQIEAASDMIKLCFIRRTKQAINDAMVLDQKAYLKFQNEERCKFYIEKAESKSNPSLKSSILSSSLLPSS